MSKKIKDTDYLFLSTCIRAMERNLLTRERMERMLDAAANEDAAKVLAECGYPEMPVVDVDAINHALAAVRDRMFADLYAFAPDSRIIDVFKLKYDYHNVKTILKSEAMSSDPNRLLVDVGCVPVSQLMEKMAANSYWGIPEQLAKAIVEAKEILAATQDPQRSDFVLDRAYFKDMETLAQETGSTFLQGYVQMQVDAANLKSLVRVLRMGKNDEYLKGVLFEGGAVAVRSILSVAAGNGALEDLYGTGSFAKAAASGQAAVTGASLTPFEKDCDDALMRYVSGAKYVAFGDAPLVGYLVAKENEMTAVRIIMTGRLAGLSADLIRERLREAYV